MIGLPQPGSNGPDAFRQFAAGRNALQDPLRQMIMRLANHRLRHGRNPGVRGGMNPMAQKMMAAMAAARSHRMMQGGQGGAMGQGQPMGGGDPQMLAQAQAQQQARGGYEFTPQMQQEQQQAQAQAMQQFQAQQQQGADQFAQQHQPTEGQEGIGAGGGGGVQFPPQVLAALAQLKMQQGRGRTPSPVGY